MTDVDGNVSTAQGSRLRIPRSRGAVGGLVVLLLGIWGALIPFIGPYFDFTYTPDDPWVWTAARGWLQVLPGVAAIVGGLLMLMSRNRVVASFGGWLSVAAGVWFVIGPVLADLLRLGDIGEPVATSDLKRALLQLTFFYGLGALILFFAATSLGRRLLAGVHAHRHARPRRPLRRRPRRRTPGSGISIRRGRSADRG
ncbi:hypothetical protein [Nocardia cyriacigeorgica]|uniref:hypothetical protein n=1 Tax=Nocardia cyriacigeorgica TaxID=135487 RepID=UPI0024565A02|nr:hypothetical protein [Nocardia cyriacigeorgica]